MADAYIDVDTAVEVQVNLFPLISTSDFYTIDEGIAYNESGMDLNWNFLTPDGTVTQTNVVPTTSGDYDWAHVGNGIYKIEIPASGGASINNDTEGVGWFTGKCDAVCPWRSLIYCFRDSDLNDKLIESAWSATRGLAGTALPDAAADAAGGLAISDNGSLDLDNNVQNQLMAYGLDHLLSVAVIGSDVADDSIIAQLVSKSATADWDDFDHTTESLQALKDTLPGAIDTELTSSHGAGSWSGSSSDIVAATGSVDDLAATTLAFISDLTEDTNDHYKGMLILFTSGDLDGQCRWIDGYNGSTKAITVSTELTDTPGNTDTFKILAVRGFFAGSEYGGA